MTNESYTAEKGEIRVPARGDRRLGRHAMSELGWVVDGTLANLAASERGGRGPRAATNPEGF